ncbi:hypothetical protein FRC10_001632 [Ceratobasidium sp. 414]|nr:hypothetical protein FRC10_001632 [Ceratobasidium sp. 414]
MASKSANSSDDEDTPPPPKQSNKPGPPPDTSESRSASPASPAPRQSRTKRKSTVLMDSDDEGSEQAPAKKAALVKPVKELAKDVTQPNGQAKPLTGMSIVFTGEFSWERERLVDATKKNGGEVLKQPGSATSFIVVGKNVSESKLRAMEKLKLRTRTEQEFMDLIKSPAPENPAPTSKAPLPKRTSPRKALPKKAAPSKKRASSPADEDEDDPPPKPPAKKAAAAKKRASSPAESDDQAFSKPSAKKGGWNRSTGDAVFDSAVAAAKAAKAAGPKALGSKDVPDGHPNALAGLTFVFTGELSSFSREEAQDLAKRRVTGQASGKTSYMVVGEGAGPGKMKKANSLGVKTIDEDGFLNLIATREGKLDAKAQEKQKAEEEKIKADARALEKREREAEKAAKAKAKAQGSDSGCPIPVPSSAQLWTTKYAPQSLKEVCGNKATIDKLQLWLHEWQGSAKGGFKKPGKNGMNMFRAVLLAGPPGIGKTTSAHLVSNLEGYTPIELNASDTRSKKLIENGANINNTSLDGWMGGGGATNVAGVEITDRTVLIMDEVDGMSAGDRGGVGALITLIKKTKVPIICIANDDRAQKLKSLLNSAFRLTFKKEKMKIPANVIDQLVAGAQSDIRQVLNMLSTWKLSHDSMDFDEGKELARANEKYSIKSPFEVTSQILGPYTFSQTSRHTLNDKIEMYFHDYSFVPLFIQENYLKTQPSKISKLTGQEAALEHLRLMDRAASSISDGDLVDAMIHGTQQQWSLMPLHAALSTVRPSSFLFGPGIGYGGPGAMAFPQWLGQNSKQGKLQRQLGDIQIRMRLRVSGDRGEIRQSYIPALFPRMVRPLVDNGNESISDIIETMDSYYLSKDDWDSVVELGVGVNNGDELVKKIPGPVKAAFTRKYNSSDHPIPFHKAQEFGKPSTKIAAEAPPDHEDVFEVDNEEEDEEEKKPKGKGKASEIERDKLLKETKPKAAAKGKKANAKN